MTNISLNGVDVTRLVETVHAVTAQPELGAFTFQAMTDWKTGGQSSTTIMGFDVGGAPDTTRHTPFVVNSDEPPALLGQNAAPNAVELLLAALTSCLTVGVVYNAAAKGITISRLSLKIEGTGNLQGFLGLSETVRPGFEAIHVHITLDSDGSPEALQALKAHVEKTSPVLDSLLHPVPVTIDLS